MIAPILTTKLFIPPPPSNLVPRPRLIKQLKKGIEKKLTIISAPAGFGKTTLASECVADCEYAVAWYSLDEGDDDLVRFLSYVVAALQTINKNIQVGISSISGSSRQVATEHILTELINQIAQSPGQSILVLDDYHAIESLEIDQAVAFLVSNLPPQMHLVIVTRTDPSFPLSRLRSRGQLTEIRVNDLRFTPNEAANFLEKGMGLKVSADEIATLEARTEGWITGLQLAAISMQQLKNPLEIARFVENFSSSNRYILDYLSDEVLNQSPGGTRDFLLKTSILNRLTAPLCNVVTQQDNSFEILEKLEVANLFLIPLDDERRWYRYHHLFRDLLQARLKRLAPDTICELHTRASEWFAENGLLGEAIQHCIRAADFKRAAKLIQEFWMTESGGGIYYTTIVRWLESLPDEIHRAYPNLGIIHGWMLALSGQLDALAPRLKQIEDLADEPLPAEITLKIDALLGYQAYRQGRFADSIEVSLRTIKALGPEPFNKDLEFSGLGVNLGHSYRLVGNINESKKWFLDLMVASQAKDNLHLTIMNITGLARTFLFAGELQKATAACLQGLTWCDQIAQKTMRGPPMPVTSFIHRNLANLYIEMNKLDNAQEHLQRLDDMTRQYHITQNFIPSYVIRSMLCYAKGDIQGAEDALFQIEKFPDYYKENCATILPPVAAIRAKMQLHLAAISNYAQPNLLEEVEQWVNARGFSKDGAIETIFDEFEYLVWVRLLLAQGRSDDAIHVLKRLLPDAEEKGRVGSVIEINILQALAHQVRGESNNGLAAIKSALIMAEPENFVRIFVNEGKPLEVLLHRAAEAGIACNYVNILLEAFLPHNIAAQPPPPLSNTQFVLVEPLSEREFEVLQLLSSGATNQEIAGELFIAVTTAKKHVSNIIGKLGVSNRTQAVSRARELNLI